MDIKPYCFIMRGLPGSGKSTLAKEFAEIFAATICSADDFFVILGNGTYKFDAKLIGVAHSRCRDRFDACIDSRSNVIVDNTNVKPAEYKHYVDKAENAGYRIYFVEPATPWAMDINECFIRNTHGVPLATLEKMCSALSNTQTLTSRFKSINTIEEVD
jgi:2',3'-cyclic-nucleotide 3'-phosphodiesterase